MQGVKIRLSDEDLSKIINMYNDTKSLREVGLKYTICTSSVKRILNKNGISTILDSERQSLRRRVYTYKRDYFNKLDEPNKAYILGWVLSDGHFYESKFNQKQVRLKITDLGILSKIREELEYTGPLLSDSSIDSKYKESKSLILCGDNLYDDLMNLGGCKNKSENLLFPEIPPEFLPHFIRGFFDGDGCIYLEKRGDRIYASVSIISTKNFCEGLYKYLTNLGLKCYYQHDKRHSDNIWSIRIRNMGDIYKFYKLLYSNGNLFLERKKNKFIEFFNYRKETFNEIFDL